MGSDAEVAPWQAALTVRAGVHGANDVVDLAVHGLASPTSRPDAPPPLAGGVSLASDVVDGLAWEALPLAVLPCAAVVEEL